MEIGLHKNPLVSVIMGSDSDLPVMSKCAETLKSLKIPFELTIVSAHRTPKRLYEFAQNAEGRGVKVIVAGAGGAAHLPGMAAAMTALPVIGVPIMTKTLNGVDSLHSIVQMPPGIPVATVAINGAENAGLLAAKILGIGEPAIMQRVKAYAESLENTVLKKAETLETSGFEQYLRNNL